MYICVCNGISDRQVKSALQQEGLSSVSALRKHFDYQEGCCGKCHPSLRELLDEHCRAGAEGCPGPGECRKSAEPRPLTN